MVAVQCERVAYTYIMNAVSYMEGTRMNSPEHVIHMLHRQWIKLLAHGN